MTRAAGSVFGAVYRLCGARHDVTEGGQCEKIRGPRVVAQAPGGVFARGLGREGHASLRAAARIIFGCTLHWRKMSLCALCAWMSCCAQKIARLWSGRALG